MSVEDRRFVTPFHLLVLRPKELVGVDKGGHVTERAEAIKYEIHTIGNLRALANLLMEGTLAEGPPLVVQFAELMALGCLKLEDE